MVFKKGLTWISLARLLTQCGAHYSLTRVLGQSSEAHCRTSQKSFDFTTSKGLRGNSDLTGHVTLAGTLWWGGADTQRLVWGRLSVSHRSLPSCNPCYRQSELQAEGQVSSTQARPQPPSRGSHHALCAHESIFLST